MPIKAKHNSSSKKIFNIYMKTSRKRVLTTILIGAIIFLTLTSFLMIWYNFRYNSFFNYIDQNHDWLDDNKTSINSFDFMSKGYSIEADLLSKGITEVTSKLEELMPNVQKSFNGKLGVIMYNNIIDLEYDKNYLQTFDENIINLIEENLIEGRMPENYTELIYYKSTSDSMYNTSDIVELSGISYKESQYYNQFNYTIVGIVDNLDAKLYNKGFSTDMFKESYSLEDFESKAQFFTTNTKFYDLINSVENFSSILSAIIDVDYQFAIEHIKNKNKYLAAFQDFWNQYPVFEYMPGYLVSFCEDLIEALIFFERDWQTKTISLIGASVPIIFLFGVISIETFNIGNHEQASKYRLLKTLGLEDKVLTKMILLENIITIGSSFLIGFTFGLIAGFLIFLGLDISPEVSYIVALGQAIIILSLIALFIIFTLAKFGFDLIQTRKASIITTSQYKSKRKKTIRKIFTFPEVVSLIPGALLTTIGILFLNIFSYSDYNNGSNITQATFLFYIMATFGILLLLISIFLLLSRLISLLFRVIGRFSWKKTKSYFTLALKHLSIYNKNYQRIMLVIFVLGLGIIPGLIMTKSISLHAPLEANLTTGCSDILIEDWSIGNHLLSNISNINGVEETAEVKIQELNYLISSGLQQDEYRIRFYVLQNITEYLDVVNLELLEEDGYTEDDISELSTDLNYLMNRKFAQKNDYDKGAVFNTRGITDEIYQPLDLNYINDFSYYPLLSRQDPRTNDYNYFTESTKIDLVVSMMTAELILNTTSLSIENSGYLLIKTEAAANKTKIQEELSNQFGYKSITPEQIQQIIIERINTFAKAFLIISSIIAALAIFLFGTVNAINTYKQRLRIIELEIQSGAKKRLIWGNFTIELVIIVLIPLIISIGIAIPIINGFSSYLLNITEVYKKFTAWQPWWLLLLVAIVGLAILIIGWITRLIPLVNKYRPIKQE
ncbi:MAG: ABC transporter permease [Asgard group archaeon]|nr:ABC transporter permease [Asgard group archaeon]